MIQDTVKTQVEQLKKQGEKVQAELNKRLDAAKTEGQRILVELGVTSDPKQLTLNELVAELRAANPSLKEFIRKLDVATYDNRFRIHWDTSMISAYAKKQAEKSYIKDLKPKLDDVRNRVSEQLKEVQVKARELRTRISA